MRISKRLLLSRKVLLVTSLMKIIMRDYYRSYICHSTGTEVLRNKIKNQGKDIECKCFTHCVKFHHYDCPLIKKPCPIHGSSFLYDIKEEKIENELHKPMLLSIPAFLKTEELFQPLKNLLPHKCTQKTKFDSPISLAKEFYKHSQIQTDPEDLKEAYGSNLFVEKTKSLFADKTNKIRKLKHCLYSACDSINKKTQTTFTENNEEFFRKKIKKTCDVSVSVVSPLGEKLNRDRESDDSTFSSGFKWYFGNKIKSSNSEKPSGTELTDSDIVAVTEKTKHEHLINSKVFEIKPKKSSSDFLFFKSKKKFTQVSPTYYFSSSIHSDVNPNKVRESLGASRRKYSSPMPKQQQQQQQQKETVDKKENEDESERKDKYKESSEESRSSEKYLTESSDSVYFTPFILMPAGMENYNDDDRNPETEINIPKISVDKPTQFDGKKESVSIASSDSFLKKEEYFPLDENEVENKQDSVTAFKEQKKTETYIQYPTSQKSSRHSSLEIRKIDFKSLVLEIIRKVHSSGFPEKNSKGNQTEESFMLSSSSKEIKEIKLVEESSKNKNEEVKNLELNDSNCECIKPESVQVEEKITTFTEFTTTGKKSNDRKNEHFENFKKIDMELDVANNDGGNNTSVSDLSELIKIIRHFNTMIENPLEVKEDEILKEKRSHTGTNTDFVCICNESYEEFLHFKASKEKKFVDVKIQTSWFSSDAGKTPNSPEQLKIRQSVRMDDAHKDSDIFICKLCAKKICTVMVDAETSYNPPQPPGVKTVPPTKTTNSSKVTPSCSKTPDNSPNAKVSITGSNVKTPKPQLKTTSTPRKPLDSEKCLKAATNYHVEIQAPRVCQERVVNTTIPESVRKKNLEKPKCKNVTPVRSRALTPQQGFQESQNCECEKIKDFKSDQTANDLYPSLPVNPRPGTRIPRPDTNRNATLAVRNKLESGPNVFHYVAAVSMSKPKKLLEFMQDMGQTKIKEPSKSSVMLVRSNSNQKRNFDKVEDSEGAPTGKKVKHDNFDNINVLDFIQESSFADCLSVLKEKQNSQRQTKTSPEKEVGFVWMSPAQQISIISNHPTNQHVKKLKSEKALNPRQNITSGYKQALNLSDFNLTESLQNKVNVKDNSVQKLYKCSQCKSLIFLKPGNAPQSNELLVADLKQLQEIKSDFKTTHQENAQSTSLFSIEDLLENESTLFGGGREPEKCVFNRINSSSLFGTSASAADEINSPKQEIQQRKHPSSFLKSQRSSFTFPRLLHSNTEVSSSSKSFDAFWFETDGRKKK